DGRDNQSRRPAQENRDRQILTQLFGRVIMKAAAFLNLPVQPGRVRIVNLHAIDPEVVFPGDWMFGVDEWQRYERAAIFLPGREDRELFELHLLLDNFRNRRPRHVASSQLEKIAHQAAMLPKFRS